MKTPIMNPNLGNPQTTRAATLSPRSTAFAALVAMLHLLLSLPGASQAVVNTSSLMSAWTTGTGTVTPTLVTNPSGTFTIPPSPPSNGMLVVTIAGELNGDPTSVTWGGSGMTKAISTIAGSGNNAGYSGIYYLANPASGTGPLVVSYTGTRLSAYAVFATGVSPTFNVSDSAVANSTTGGSPFDTNTPASAPSTGALVVTSFGAAPTTGATTILTVRIVKAIDNSELSPQLPPLKAPNANSSAGSSHAIMPGDALNIKGRTTNNLPSGNTAMTIASFTAAGPPVFDHLAVTAASPQIAGVAFNVTITGQNSANETVDNSTAIITMSSPSSFMEFSWDSGVTWGVNTGTLVNGTRTIQARNKKAETTTILANGGGAATTTPPSVTTEAGAYTQLQILAPGEVAAPGTATGKTGVPTVRDLNTPFDVTVNAVDANWNPVPTATADPVIGITSTASPLATLPADATISAELSSYSVTFNTAPGPFTVTATDAVNSRSATTPPLTVYGPAITWIGGLVDEPTQNYLWDTTTLNWSLPFVPPALPVATLYTNPSQVTFNNDSSSPTVSIVGTVSPSTITVTGSNNYTFNGSGSIAGTAGGFTKSGSGTLTLSTANSYTGPTTFSGGFLIPTVADALPSTSALTVSGGLIGVQDLDFTRLPGLLAGQVKLTSGGFTAFGTTGVVSLGGISTPVQLTMASTNFASGGTLILSHADATRAIEIKNPIALQNGTNFFQVADSGNAAVDAILSGAITAPVPAGGQGVSKTGDGTLMLSNTGNTFGNCFIDNGTIILGAANVIPDGASFTIKKSNVAGGAQSVLDLNGFSDTVGTVNLGDPGTGNGATPSIINSDISTPAKAAAILTLNANLNYNAGAAASLNNQATISANLAMGSAAVRNITVGDGAALEDLVISGELSGGAISKLGLGVLVLEKPIYSGDTTVSAGTLIVRKTGTQTNANPNNDTSTVTVAAATITPPTPTTLKLEYTGTDKVARLIINSVTLPDGIYGNAASLPPVIANSQITGDGTITVESPYVTWSGGAPFTGDANDDGVQNGLAWLLGAANPNVNANGLLPLVTTTSGALNMTFSMLNAASRGSAVLEVQHSSDLGISDPWTGVLVPNVSGTTGGVTFVITPGSPLNGVQATIAPSEAAGGKVFSRLRGVK